MPLAIGTRLGPYEILAPIGGGGMGEVHRARDTRLNRDVAIKVLPEHLAKDPQAMARFEREAKAVAALSHPNILVLYDVGSHEGINYAVTELLEGETLRELISRAPLPWRKAADLGAAIADGLAAAHAKGIVHLDLKPANIFLTSDGRVKILDFGLARQWRAVGQDEETATMTDADAGVVAGTIGYMSPEQVRGGAVGAASDIFSLGCVLYEMVTGRRAFSGPTGSDIMAAILKEEPPEIAGSGKEVPGEMASVVERCLAKNPDQRFQSARDLAFALRTLSSAAVEKIVPAPLPLRRLRWVFLAAAALLILAGAAGWLYWNRAGQSITALAVLPFVNVGGNQEMEYLSDGITESLIDSLSELPNLKVISRSAVSRYKGREVDIRAAGRDLGVHAVLTGRIAQRGDSLAVSAELVSVYDDRHLWGEQYSRRLTDALAVQNEIASQISDKLRPRLSSNQRMRMARRQTSSPEAYQLYLKGRFYASKGTPDGMKEGLEYFHEAIDVDPNYALAYAGIAFSYNWDSDWVVPPSEAMPKAKQAAQKAVELDDALAEGHIELGNVTAWYNYDWAGAEREFQRALELNPNYAPAHEFYGIHLIVTGRTEEGLSHLRQAAAIDPLSPEVAALRGFSLCYAGRSDEGIAELHRCLGLDPGYWAGYYYLAQAFQKQARYDDAITMLKKAREIDGNSLLTSLAELVRAYALSGKKDLQRQALAELVARSRSSYVSGYIMATVYAALGDKQEAFTQLERAYEQRSFFLLLLKADPELASLRSDPRFERLLRRMNFPR